jgi:hypothetical protein
MKVGGDINPNDDFAAAMIVEGYIRSLRRRIGVRPRLTRSARKAQNALSGFASESASCVSPQKVLHRLQADRKTMGGKTVMLADGLQQSFADAWRREAEVPSVKVSSVVAHLFSDETGTDWNAGNDLLIAGHGREKMTGGRPTNSSSSFKATTHPLIRT